MSDLSGNKSMDELREENKKLIKDLKITEKLLENYRNCLLVFNRNCNCLQSTDIKDKLNKLENYFKVFDQKIVHKLRPTDQLIHTTDANSALQLTTDLLKETQSETIGGQTDPSVQSIGGKDGNHTDSELNKEVNKGCDDNRDNITPKEVTKGCDDKCVDTEVSADSVVKNDTIDEDMSVDDKHLDVSDEEFESVVKKAKKDKKSVYKRVSIASDDDSGSDGKLSEIDLEVELGTSSRRGKQYVKNFTCEWPGCDKKYSKEWELTAHFRHNHSNERPFKCSDCSKCFTIEKYLKRHKDICTGIKYQCEYRDCQFESPYKKQLKAHEMIHLADRTDASELLDKGMRKRSKRVKKALDKSVKTEVLSDSETTAPIVLGGGVRVRGTAGFSYERPKFDKSLLKKRLKINAEVICPEIGCGKVFKLKRYLHKHIQTVHLNLRPYKCPMQGCESTFKTAEALANHKASHLNERRYACDFEGCSKRFNTRHEWTQHKNRHEGKHTKNMIPCEWPGCEIMCQSRPGLEEHMNRHRGIRPYRCPFDPCLYSFFTKFELKHHEMKIHNSSQTDSPTYLCDFEGCQKSFITPIDLKRHKRSTHTGSFMCTWPECGQRFASNYNLTGHMNRHMDIRAFRCDFVNCDRSYYGRRDLLKHINKCHTN